MCFHSLTSSFSTCPVKQWWDIFFHHLLLLLSGWAGVPRSPQGPLFLHLHTSSQQTRPVQFTKKHGFIYYKPFKIIWLLKYPQHLTLICFADGRRHLANSLYCLVYPQPTAKLFWCFSGHFHFTLSPGLSQAPWISQVGTNWYSGGFLSWHYTSQPPDRPLRLSGHQMWGCAVLLRGLSSRTQFVLLVLCQSLLEAWARTYKHHCDALELVSSRRPGESHQAAVYGLKTTSVLLTWNNSVLQHHQL